MGLEKHKRESISYSQNYTNKTGIKKYVCTLFLFLVFMSCKFRKKPYHPAPVTFRPGLPQDHAKQSGVGEELGTDNTTLCRDATSKTAEARHESGAQQIPLLLGAVHPSLHTCPPHLGSNALSVRTFHIPPAYQRDINTFLAWHSGEEVCPRDVTILPTLSKCYTAHCYEEIQETHRKKHINGE